MSLYPNLEELLINKEIKAQHEFATQISNSVAQYPSNPTRENYSELAREYLGFDLASVRLDDYGNVTHINTYEPTTTVVPSVGQTISLPPQSGPIVPRDPVIVTNSVRELQLCKNRDGRVGIQLQDMSGGIFVAYVEHDSPAALGGLRFGDQVLKINNTLMTGKTGKAAMEIVKKAPAQKIVICIRDRPLERCIVLNKDSHGNVGICIKNGKVAQIVKDSSAARNGVLIDHQIVEINGINVLGVPDKKMREYLRTTSTSVKLTVIPSYLYEAVTKRLESKLLKKMDRTTPVV